MDSQKERTRAKGSYYWTIPMATMPDDDGQLRRGGCDRADGGTRL